MPPPHPHLPPPMKPIGLALDIGVRLGALVIAAWIGARWLARPIARLARAAQAIGRDIQHPPLDEDDGTRECRDATRVFNLMQARIRQQLDERDRFVAAVSHDLRTPLTRMALRVEASADDSLRHGLSKDIAEMNAMIAATLDYLRGAAEPMMRIDLASLVESLVDDRQACGQDVHIDAASATGPIEVVGELSAVRRCIDNLVDNAVRYGGAARLRLHADAALAHLDVRDDGPGIAEAELPKVMAPFYRVEGSRNRASGGVGLGLSIAHDIAQRHRGGIGLRNATPRGLVASLRLPRNTSAGAHKVPS
jgi:protein-histidine pros-kinase